MNYCVHTEKKTAYKWEGVNYCVNTEKKTAYNLVYARACARVCIRVWGGGARARTRVCDVRLMQNATIAFLTFSLSLQK